MTTSHEKRMLFGGAFRCAGLATASITLAAHAEFVPDAFQGGPNISTILAADQAGGELVFDSSENFAGGFPSPLSYAGLGGSLDAYAGPNLLGASIDVGDPSTWGSAFAQVVQVFTVNDSKKALLEWDLIGADYGSTAYLLSFDTGVLANYGAGTAGSLSFSLTPGMLYGFIGRIGTGQLSSPADGLVTLTWVPAPGAFALLGLGMFTTKRRRRDGHS